MIALIDYGAGNLTSVRKALATLGAEFTTPQAPEEIAGAAGIIVPGVGHFDATRALGPEWRHAILDAVERGRALFGICLGMQWLFAGSDEAPALAGLGIFPGNCVHLQKRRTPESGMHPTTATFKVPHVGWNSLEVVAGRGLMREVQPGDQVYFTHSYAAPVIDETAAITAYGDRFTAAVERDRVAGVQFHPEKSGDVGLRILRNWLEFGVRS